LFVRIFYYVYSSAISKNGLKRIKLNFASRFSSCFYWGNKILDPPLRPRAAEPSCTEEKVNLTECLVPDYEASRLVTSERCGKEKYLLSLPGIETRFLGCSVYTDAWYCFPVTASLPYRSGSTGSDLGHVHRTGPPYRGCDITSALLTYLICSCNGTLVQVTVSQVCPIRFISSDWRRIVRNVLGSNLGRDTSNCEWGFTSISSYPRGKCRDSTRFRPRPLPSKSFLSATSHNIKELCILLTEGAFMLCMTVQNVNRFVRL
jgi:hypothetical protein